MSFDLKLSNGDLVLTPNGDIEKIYNENKLSQDIVKILLTPQGSSKLYPWYGSPLSDRVVGKLLEDSLMEYEMTNAILYSLNILKDLQSSQELEGQYLSPTEVLSQIRNVQVVQNQYDSRAFSIVVEVATRRGNIVEETFTITT